VNIRSCCRWAVAAGAVLLLDASLLSADGIKLDGGGSLSGAVTAGSKVVAVRTSTGAVIVFDRTDVKQVTRGRGKRQGAAEQTQVER
jgi:hypothetical protein